MSHPFDLHEEVISLQTPEPIVTVWKTGQRVPWTGNFVCQHGITTLHLAHHTFPPCVEKPHGVDFRRAV